MISQTENRSQESEVEEVRMRRALRQLKVGRRHRVPHLLFIGVFGDAAVGEGFDGPERGDRAEIDAAGHGAGARKQIGERVGCAAGSGFSANALEVEDFGIVDGIVTGEQEISVHSEGRVDSEISGGRIAGERYERLEVGFVAHLSIRKTVVFVAAVGWRKDARAIAEVIDHKDVDPARREGIASGQGGGIGTEVEFIVLTLFEVAGILEFTELVVNYLAESEMVRKVFLGGRRLQGEPGADASEEQRLVGELGAGRADAFGVLGEFDPIAANGKRQISSGADILEIGSAGGRRK